MRIVLINLERATERYARMKERFIACGLEFDYQKAIDWHDLTAHHHTLVDYDIVRRKSLRMQSGQLACWLSHRKVLLDLIDNGPEMVTVLEDDVCLSPDLPEVLNRITELKRPFGIIFLHRGPTKRKFLPHFALNSDYRLGWILFSSYGTQGYVITREAARQFLMSSMPICNPIDRALAGYWHHGLITYCLDPPVVYHCNEGESFISESERHTATMRKGLRYYLRRRWMHLTEGFRQKKTFTALVFDAYRKGELFQPSKDRLVDHLNSDTITK